MSKPPTAPPAPINHQANLNLAQRKRLNPSDPLAHPVFFTRNSRNKHELEKLGLNNLARKILRRE